MCLPILCLHIFFFFNDTATTEIYTLSLHDALPISHIGMQEITTGQRRRGPAEFTGARSARFSIFPDSALARKPPQWVVAAELVETTRLWARVVAAIEPQWVEPLAAHLVKRAYSEPHWDGRRGAAMALERVILYGLPLVAGRRVSLSLIDPVLAREL